MLAYTLLDTFVQRAAQVAGLVGTLLASLRDIAAGRVAGAIGAVTGAIKGGMALLLSFLAGLAHLGGIGAKVRAVIATVKGAIEKGIDALAAALISHIPAHIFDAGRAHSGTRTSGTTSIHTVDTRTLAQKERDLSLALGESETLLRDQTISDEHIIKVGLPHIRTKYQMSVLTLVRVNASRIEHTEVVYVEGEINPRDRTKNETRPTGSPELDAIRKALTMPKSAEYFDRKVEELGPEEAINLLHKEMARTAETYQPLQQLRDRLHAGPNIEGSPTIAIAIADIPKIGAVEYAAASGPFGLEPTGSRAAVPTNAVSPTHAEGRALAQLAVAMKAKGIKGGKVVLYVDKPPCTYCKGMLTVMKREYDIQIDVHAPPF